MKEKLCLEKKRADSLKAGEEEMWGVTSHRTGSAAASNSLSALLYVTSSPSVAICRKPALCLLRLVCLVSATLLTAV